MQRGWLGVDVQDPAPKLAGSLGCKRRAGALVTHVMKGGLAEMAGMKRGDREIRCRDNEILNAGNLMKEMVSSPIGQYVDLIAFRDGRERILKIRVGSSLQARNMQSSLIKRVWEWKCGL